VLDQGTMSLVELARSLKPELVGDWLSKIQWLDRRFERNCTMKKYRVLAHLMAHGKATATEIARRVEMSVSEVRSYLVSLSDDGLVLATDHTPGPIWFAARGHDDSL
jgi:DNA-binding MarR family transcriptional regulator